MSARHFTQNSFSFPPGARYNRRNVELTCIVECDPLCTISWFRNGEEIVAGQNQSQFNIRSAALLPDPDRNILLHVESTLAMDLDRWAGDERLRAPNRDTANYTCRASGNVVGPGVESETVFRLHYPPRNITVMPRYEPRTPRR